MGDTKERFSRSAAVHEAGRTVVAWSFGLALGAVWVNAGDACGGTEIGPADHLMLTERIAVLCAGGIAQAVFGCSGNELATFRDNIKIMKLLGLHDHTEESDALAVRAQGYEIAEAIMEANHTRVSALADRLVKHGRIEASDVLNLMNGR